MTAVRASRPALAGEAFVVLVLVFAYDRIREFATTRADLAISNGRHLLSVESWLHLDIEPMMNRVLSQHAGLELLSSWYYQLMHLSVTLVTLLWVYVRHPHAYRPARNALVGINVVALVVFWVFPVAPPRLIPGAGFIDSTVVTNVADKATAVSPDLYAAMPSLHVAWATWVAVQVLLVTSHRWGRRLAVAHAVVTCLAVIATANHYLLDVAAGFALALAVVMWSRRSLSIDVRCPHVPAPRSGGRPADRDPAGVGIARQRSYRHLGEDRCSCGRTGRQAELRAGVARPGPARRRRRAGLSEIRLREPDCVLVMLTARRDEMDVIVGLEAGADDYLTKPFGLTELLARVRAHLRRASGAGGPIAPAFVSRDLTIDFTARRCEVGGEEVRLRAKEFDLLARLATEPGHAVSRESLMADVWDENWFGSTKTLDVHMASLRRRLSDAAAAQDPPALLPTITTLRGHGYRLENPPGRN